MLRCCTNFLYAQVVFIPIASFVPRRLCEFSLGTEERSHVRAGMC